MSVNINILKKVFPLEAPDTASTILDDSLVTTSRSVIQGETDQQNAHLILVATFTSLNFNLCNRKHEVCLSSLMK